MHLINTTTLELHSFLGTIPAYVILSHTWGNDEVTFENMCKPDALTKTSEGYLKIKRCCEQAKEDGYSWAWVDTCCIDKRSSAELSEAINSMYRYYWEASKCYAYLSDVSVMKGLDLGLDSNISGQKRGWQYTPFRNPWSEASARHSNLSEVLFSPESPYRTSALDPQKMGRLLIRAGLNAVGLYRSCSRLQLSSFSKNTGYSLVQNQV